MGGWGCPHEIGGHCRRLNGVACDPGRPGCVLYGRFVFSNPAKNRVRRADEGAAATTPGAGALASAADSGDADGT